MLHRKDAVSMAVLGLLASCGLATAADVKTPALSLEPTVTTAQVEGAPSTLLMGGLDKLGVGKPISDLGINIYGWVEGGYDANLRNNRGSSRQVSSFDAATRRHADVEAFSGAFVNRPSPFTEEVGNHAALNQVDLRIEKIVDSKKFDVGGLVEGLFGTDSNYIRSNGIEYQTPGDNPGEVPQFEIPQAYVDVNVPIGNGLKIRAGKFVTLLGYETIDPRGNPFYSHSNLFSMIPFTQTGVMGFYNLNDQWSVALGATRGWDQSTEDNNGSPDVLGQVTYTPSKQLQFMLNYDVGPQDFNDTSHYRVTLDPIVVWQATDKLKLAAEGLYNYDGGFNAPGVDGGSHAYGDTYGVAAYGQYVINDYLIGNLRAEWSHYDVGSSFNGTVPTTNLFEVTAGVTIKPLPKDPIGQNLSIRPEVRYDFSEDHAFSTGTSAYRDQWTVGADVIFTF